jgi:beta-galactosidase
VLSRQGYITDYLVVPLDQESQRKTLRIGVNLIAVHCKQTGGGQFVDVHLIDADHVPKLPQPKRSTQPYQSSLITTWGAEVTPENAWTEHPRPQLERKEWTNLNGHWDYAITPREQKSPPAEWTGKILVPFALESRLSGVQRLLLETETLWYHREFTLPSPVWGRILLNFEAVDYRCEVFVNGKPVGKHQGGNTPFAFDITEASKEGVNQLLVRVDDDTEEWQLRGKQVRNAHGIWYTQVSGIWQTVWLEQVGASYVQDLKIDTDASAGTITVTPKLAGKGASTVRVVLRDGEQEVSRSEGIDKLVFRVPNAKLWSPGNPHLYSLEVTVLDGTKTAVDQVKSYAGIRSVGKVRDAGGHWRLTLNGKPIFHLGPLDQGWWPDGLLTPPSDEGMLYDIEFLKAAGFNMIRKHIKVEPRRYYYHCDRLGMMLWQDQVSAGHNPPWTRLKADPKDADWPDQHHAQFMLELDRMVENLKNHPSIVMWVPYNEAWGQHRTMEVGKWMVERDASRLVNVASGGNFWPVGDIVDHHNYPDPDFPFEPARYDNFVKVVGEFGGHGYPVPEHLWKVDSRNWGYGGLPKSEEEYRQRYVTSLEKLKALKEKGIAAGIYTQTTDVEVEINGLITYDRKVIKIPAMELARLHKPLVE